MDTIRTPEERAADEAAIRELERAYDSAWNAADLPALTGLLAPDIVVIDPLGRTSAGRDAVESMLAAVLDTFGRGSSHASEIERVSLVTDDVALADGEAVITGFRDAAGEVTPPFRHRFTDVVVRTGGEWRIAHVRACGPEQPR